MTVDHSSPQTSSQPLVFRDNSEWLRYALLAGAVGMCVLVVNNLTASAREIGKLIGGTLGALLLGFGGYVLQVRRVVLNPVRRDITVTSRGLSRTTTETIRFDDVTKLLLLLTYDRDGELSPPNRQRERWSVVLMLKDRSLPVNLNSYPSKDQAMVDAKRIQQLLKIEISDNAEDSIAYLAQSGRIIDAVVTTTQTRGMTLTQAKEYVEKQSDRSSSSSA